MSDDPVRPDDEERSPPTGASGQGGLTDPDTPGAGEGSPGGAVAGHPGPGGGGGEQGGADLGGDADLGAGEDPLRTQTAGGEGAE